MPEGYFQPLCARARLLRARSIRVYTNVPTQGLGRFTTMKKSAEHSRRPGSNGRGKKGKGWRSHRRGSVPADCIRSATTATADHARPGTVSGPAADHLRTATTTGTEGQRTGSGPASRRLSSGYTRPAQAVVAFTTQKGGNCCHNCLLWQQFRHLQQVLTLSETRPAAPPPLQWHRLTS